MSSVESSGDLANCADSPGANLPTARELAGYTLPAQHPLTREWVDDHLRLELLSAEHELDVQLARDMEIARARAARFAPGQPPERLLNRWTPVADGLLAMLSMRYEGGDPDRPFVDASPLSRPFTTDDLPALTAAADQSYHSLEPRYLRLWSAQPAGAIPGTGPDKRFLAGRLSDLRAMPPDVPPSLTLRASESLDDYPSAERAYRAVRADHPGHVEQAGLQSRADLEETLTAGLLFDVLIEDEWAGYVAITTGSEAMLGLPAYVVQELVLAPEQRGRNLGSYLTTLAARALPDERPILLGTIHAENAGALRAATNAGRVDIGGWLQVPLRPPGTPAAR